MRMAGFLSLLLGALLTLKVLQCSSSVTGGNKDVEFQNNNSNMHAETASIVSHSLLRGDKDDFSMLHSPAPLQELRQQNRLLGVCGATCSSNSQCAGGGGCNFCNGFECYNPYTCGESCIDHSACSFSIDGCYLCDKNTNLCSSDGGSDDKPCINTNAQFQAALIDPSYNRILLCPSTQLVLTGNGDAFKSSRSNFKIYCIENRCGRDGSSISNTDLNSRCGPNDTCGIIRKSGSGRLLELSGGTIVISGLAFDHGNGGGGGAIYIQGNNNSLEYCLFRDNYSNGNGGAVNWNSGNIVNCSGFNNQATGWCNGVYSRATNGCDTSVNTGTQNQCNAYCNNTSLRCNRVTGPCQTCDTTSKTCYSGGSKPTNCGKYCNISSDCTNQQYSGPCTLCSGTTCIDPNQRLICVRDESAIRLGLQATDKPIVEICENTKVEITSGELFTSLPNKTLRCRGGGRTCTIVRPSSVATIFRLLHATGNNFSLQNIILQNGHAPSRGDGGGALLTGQNNKVIGCEFIGNQAPGGRGGALSIQSGKVVDCKYEGNTAAQCINAFMSSSGSCYN